MDRFRDFFDTVLLHTENWELRVINIVWVLLILVAAFFLRWLFQKFIDRQCKKNRIDEGKAYAIYSVASYIIFITAAISAIDTLGFNITVLLASSTALFIGLGLGLQDLFRDMVAGFIILFERSVSAGDIIEANGIIGKVEDVGIRTTTILSRERIILIIPNSKLTTENVVNWSQNGKETVFKIKVGVAYGSDTAKVEQLLLEAAREHKQVMKKPEPFVLFKDFGESSLDFELYFYSKNLFGIELSKSELRLAIDQKFRDHQITIPFPQRDVWFKNSPPKDIS